MIQDRKIKIICLKSEKVGIYPIHLPLRIVSKGYNLPLLLLNIVLQYTIKKGPPKSEKGLRLDRTHQLLLYTNFANLFGENTSRTT